MFMDSENKAFIEHKCSRTVKKLWSKQNWAAKLEEVAKIRNLRNFTSIPKPSSPRLQGVFGSQENERK